MAEIICMGELLVDFVPTTTGVDLAAADLFKKAAGGAPANVAVGLARLGVPSAFMGKVGEDGFGHFLADTLAQAGVDITPLRFTAAARTALAFVSLRADGDREFLFYRNPSADMMFAPDDVDEAAIAGARLLHFGSISLIGEPSRSATLQAVALARQYGKRISYDPNLRLALWPDETAARTSLRLGLQQADIVKISAEEIQFLTGLDDPVAGARALWHDRLVLMAVTCGAQGCIWLTPDAAGEVAGFPVAAVDATGAGDAFMAGLLAGVRDHDAAALTPAALDRICRFANATGAITTTARGAIPSLPDRPAVHAFLTAHGHPISA
ncbi:Fructokinase [Rhodovastum atsumiense]|uniref:Fructokinase n=1 Tax=Rhodovastum atsumiense TaxID=504468 RepID=A0A5M6IS23_9PROT|nr:PfkB family carbohydrate kinase [Rhodovastum atsumiense]KAA5611100.1 fructokinase [Rhodovastum atsumiense]CAH2599165.1 Fructokinase [Rhodovastum atsumiense]